jgi:hypothetical protein
MSDATLMNDPLHKPWYKHGWLWLVIGLPLSAVVAGITTVFIAAYNPDSLVADEYYKEGLAINAVIDREQHARDLGLKARMEISEDRLRLELQGVDVDQIKVKFFHPTRSAYDQELLLPQVEDGVFQAAGLKKLAPVSWYVHVEDLDNVWRIEGRYNPADGPVANLVAK